ncbi:MAG: copper chaperone PCu(A)C [bacterium]|nr:copper chaperone PCu(A)C [bacterium]
MSGRMILFAILASLLATPALAGDLKIANGWVSRPIHDEAASGYFVIQNRGSEPRTLVGATSPRCESVSIRRAVVRDGRMASEEMKNMQIPAGGAVAFAPRGLFLRLISPEKLAAGESVPIELELADGEKIGFDATVRDE